eukprot:m.665516 g.665516  ORF g.665516 m.665516 type:complete len:59 (-) comp58492_c2_seq11:729-905(-)
MSCGSFLQPGTFIARPDERELTRILHTQDQGKTNTNNPQLGDDAGRFWLCARFARLTG